MIFAALRAHNLMEPMLIFTFLCMKIRGLFYCLLWFDTLPRDTISTAS
jgi:hypothetical protein